MSDYTPPPKHEVDATIMTGAGNLMRDYAVLYLQAAQQLIDAGDKERVPHLIGLIKAATACERAAKAVEDAVGEILAVEIIS